MLRLVRKLLCCRAGCIMQGDPGVMNEEEMWRGRKKWVDLKVYGCPLIELSPFCLLYWVVSTSAGTQCFIWGVNGRVEVQRKDLLCVYYQGNKTTPKATEDCNRWEGNLVSYWMICSSKNCFSAFQKRGSAHTVKEEENKNEADRFIFQTVLYFWMLTSFNMSYCNLSLLVGRIVLPVLNVPQMHLFHKACHQSTSAITKICHILFVCSQDLTLLLLINLRASVQFLGTLRKVSSQGAPKPRNIAMKRVVKNFSCSPVVGLQLQFKLVNIYLWKESKQNRKAPLFS